MMLPSVQRTCQSFFPQDMQLPFGRAAASLPGSEDQWGLSVCCPVADLTRQVQEGTAPVFPPKTDFVKLAVVVLVKLISSEQLS